MKAWNRFEHPRRRQRWRAARCGGSCSIPQPHENLCASAWAAHSLSNSRQLYLVQVFFVTRDRAADQRNESTTKQSWKHREKRVARFNGIHKRFNEFDVKTTKLKKRRWRSETQGYRRQTNSLQAAGIEQVLSTHSFQDILY